MGTLLKVVYCCTAFSCSASVPPASGMLPGHAKFEPSDDRIARGVVAARAAAQTIVRQAPGATDEPIRAAIVLLRPYPPSTGRQLAKAELLARKGLTRKAFAALLATVGSDDASPLGPNYDASMRRGLRRMLSLGSGGKLRAANVLAVDIAWKSAYGAPSYLAAYTFYGACNISQARRYWAQSIIMGETTPLMPPGSFPALEYSALRMLDKTAHQKDCLRRQ